MYTEKEAKQIREFWDNQATKFSTGREASWSDLLLLKENKVLKSYLVNKGNILDIGCANGFSTVSFLENSKASVLGLDYAAEMVSKANALRDSLPEEFKKRIEFKEGNILELGEKYEHNYFDQVISKRVIINLTDREKQKVALENIAKVVKKNGLVLISDAVQTGLDKLNAKRRKLNLTEISSPWHNLYLDEKDFLKSAEKFFKVEKVIDFSSTYYFVSRVIYAYLAKLLNLKLKHDSLFNKIGISLPSIGNGGVQKLFILRKL